MKLCGHSLLPSLLLGLLCGGLFLLAPPSANAQWASSSSVVMEVGDFLDWSEEELAALTNEGTTLPDIGPNVTYQDYLDDLQGIYRGFPHSTASMSAQLELTLDNLKVHLPGLVPGTLKQAATSLHINSQLPLGYGLYVMQDKPLYLSTLTPGFEPVSERQIIPGTACDDGNCTPLVAANWQNREVPGFGYTVLGDDALGLFAGGKYRPFPTSNQAGARPALIAYRPNLGQALTNRELVVQYQVGVSPAQEAGTYTSTLVVTLVPNF